jgi:hypothetical protein
MDTSEALVSVAEGMALGTVPLMPASLSCAFLMDGGKGKDGEMFKAAGKWGEAGDKYSEAKEHLEGLVRGLSSHDWSGKDREAFEKEAEQLGQQFHTNYAYCKTAEVALGLMGVALDIYAGFAMGVGVALVAQAFACAAADCTVVGAPAAEAEANAFALECAELLETANQVLMGAMGGAAAAFQLGAIADAAQQSSEGDGSALGNLTQAEIKGGVEGAKAIANHYAGKLAGNRAGKYGEEGAGAAASKVEKEAAKKAAEIPGEWFGEQGSKNILNGLLPGEEGGGGENGGDKKGSEEDAGSYA